MPNLLTTTTNAGYLQQLENLNLYTPANVYDLKSSALVDIISGIVNGLEGVSTGFQNSLAARVLEPNTPIQQIATVQLAKAIALRAASNLRNLVLPTLNITGTDIQFRSPNYWNISNASEDTSISGLLQSILDYTPITNPIPQISIGQNKIITSDISNFNLRVQRGQGQIDSYNLNIGLNDYQPYVLNTDDDTKQYGISANATQKDIILGTYSKSLLAITNSIIAQSQLDNNGYQSLTSVSPLADEINPATLAFVNPNITDSPIAGQQTTFGSGQLIAKGDGTFTDNTQTKFLRTFNYQKPYQGTGDLMKFNQPKRANSVLQTVFPNIAPASTDSDIRNLMFSIENLAYSNKSFDLPKYEIGPNLGRAMWFPPYGLTITESINANWTNVDFLGRSEPIYTFNNRERSVNIGFMLVVDYPSQLNDSSWQSASENDFAVFFRQDNNLTSNVPVGTKNQQAVAKQQNLPVNKIAPTTPKTSEYDNGKINPTIYFDNNSSDTSQPLTDNSNYNTNNQLFYTQIGSLINFLNTPAGTPFQIICTGFASKVGNDASNLNLSKQRAQNVQALISNGLIDKSSSRFAPIVYEGDSEATVDPNSPNAISTAVVDRKVIVSLKYNAGLDPQVKSSVTDKTQQAQINAQQNNQATNVAVHHLKGKGSTLYERYKNGDTKQLILEKYSQKIDYFSPIFHSQTPEDFSTRLTFLQQCTVQGAALNAGGLNSGVNSVFGAPPVCILRLGDFFYTKIIINTINITYEPLLWDTNPEGIGMQPMIANVTIDCKVIGGQDIAGPINQLQNALSYNFYANTSLFSAGQKAQKSSAKALSSKTN